ARYDKNSSASRLRTACAAKSWPSADPIAWVARAQERTGQEEARDRLCVRDVACRDEIVDRRQRNTLDDEVLFFDAVGFALARPEPFSEEADRHLVTESGRVVKAAELGELFGFGPDFFFELPGRASFRQLARDIQLSGRQLQQREVNWASVLADQQHVL